MPRRVAAISKAIPEFPSLGPGDLSAQAAKVNVPLLTLEAAQTRSRTSSFGTGTSSVGWGPNAPVRGVDTYRLSGLCMHPAAPSPSARKDQRVDLSPFNHAELQIAIERCRFNLVPITHSKASSCPLRKRLFLVRRRLGLMVQPTAGPFSSAEKMRAEQPLQQINKRRPSSHPGNSMSFSVTLVTILFYQ